MSNSQNTENEQQNNLCTTLTEQWKKGELESGWYYVKGADGLIGMMSDYALYRVNLEHPDNEITLLAKMPTYEEWHNAQEQLYKDGIWYTERSYKELKKENAQLHKFLEEFNALEVAKENQKLKELLRECREASLDYGNHSGNYELYDRIDNAIGEKK